LLGSPLRKRKLVNAPPHLVSVGREETTRPNTPHLYFTIGPSLMVMVQPFSKFLFAFPLYKSPTTACSRQSRHRQLYPAQDKNKLSYKSISLLVNIITIVVVFICS
jgi:hypothetical protein